MSDYLKPPQTKGIERIDPPELRSEIIDQPTEELIMGLGFEQLHEDSRGIVRVGTHLFCYESSAPPLYSAKVSVPLETFGNLSADFSFSPFVFKGGLARSALASIVGFEENVKDIDVITLENHYVAMPNLLWEKSSDFRSLQDYFGSRDLTINELLLAPDIDGSFTLVASTEAIVDCLNSTICPSGFERQNDELSSRVVARAIRFAAERARAGHYVQLAIPPVIELGIYTFDLALQLCRAAESDAEHEYMMLLSRFGFIPDDVIGVADLYDFLIDELEYEGDDFIFDLNQTDEIREDDQRILGKHLFKKHAKLMRDKKISNVDLQID